MNVSIILVNYNTVDLTAACIDSIFSYTQNIQFEVIVVDNASSDGSKEFFEKDERIQYIYEYIAFRWEWLSRKWRPRAISSKVAVCEELRYK